MSGQTLETFNPPNNDPYTAIREASYEGFYVPGVEQGERARTSLLEGPQLTNSLFSIYSALQQQGTRSFYDQAGKDRTALEIHHPRLDLITTRPKGVLSSILGELYKEIPENYRGAKQVPMISKTTDETLGYFLSFPTEITAPAEHPLSNKQPAFFEAAEFLATETMPGRVELTISRPIEGDKSHIPNHNLGAQTVMKIIIQGDDCWAYLNVGPDGEEFMADRDLLVTHIPTPPQIKSDFNTRTSLPHAA